VAVDIVVATVAALKKRLADEVEERASGALAARGRFVIALPGGSVAETFFPALTNARVDWARTDFFWIDERAVGPDDPASNYALARRLWLDAAGVPLDRLHRMRGEDPDLRRAALDAAEDLIHVAGNPPRLDLALIGAGEDGHVASIFAGVERIEPSPSLLVEPVHDAPKPPARRLTLTMGVLCSARRVVVAVVGSSKADAISTWMKGGTSPLAELLQRSKTPLVLLDHDAARVTIDH
jgi:6-phosphogluconolactonase